MQGRGEPVAGPNREDCKDSIMWEAPPVVWQGALECGRHLR